MIVQSVNQFMKKKKMTISNHFFGLIQCYSEQGTCYIGNYNFNIMFISVIYLLIILIVATILFYLYTKFRFRDITPAEPEQVLDSIYSQGEAQ